jgi:thioredoxin 1
MSIVNLTMENFQNEVLNSDKPVLVDFWAGWCGPCRMVGPLVEQIAAENDGVKVGKVDIDAQPELASAFRVMSIPTLMVFRTASWPRAP